MRRAIVPLAILAVLAYLAFWPTWVDPVAWTAGRDPGWTGVFAPESLRSPAFDILETGAGPEDVTLGADGKLYTGLADGRIVRLSPDGEVEEVARTGGRPLGLGFDASGDLIVADASRGLLRVTLAGSVSLLTDRAGGTPIGFADDLDIANDGTIWFSDLTTRYPDDLHVDYWEGRATGRLLTFDPATGRTVVRADSLHYPNGVALGPGERYVLVCETLAARVTRVWLAGPRAGERERFVDGLPGYVDNISYNDSTLFWVALVGQRNAAYERHASRPRLRKSITRIPRAKIPHPMPWVHGGPVDGWVVAIDTTGSVRVCLHDPARGFGAITSANQFGDRLFLGSIVTHSVASVPLAGLGLGPRESPGRPQ